MTASVKFDECINCQLCISVCPVGAITEEDNHAKVEYGRCVFCKNCISSCPVGAIEEKDN